MDLPPGLEKLRLEMLGLATGGLQSTKVRMAAIAIAVFAVSFFISLNAFDWLSPRGALPKAAQTAPSMTR